MLALVWLLLIILIIIALILDILILSSLIDFEIDHVNPIDLCSTLEKKVNPIIVVHSAISITSVFIMSKAWPIFIVNAGIVSYIIYIRKSKNRLFEPMTIVRDMKQVKGRHIIFLVLNCLLFIFGFVETLISAFDSE